MDFSLPCIFFNWENILFLLKENGMSQINKVSDVKINKCYVSRFHFENKYLCTRNLRICDIILK